MGLRAGTKPAPPQVAASNTSPPKPDHSFGTAPNPAAPGQAMPGPRRIRTANTGPTARQNGGQSTRLYQGSWVCRGRTKRLAIAVSPRTQRPQRLRRSLQARAMPKGQRGNQGHPPLITSSSGGQGPPPWPSMAWPSLANPWLVHISRAWGPLTQPCQPCQANPGSNPTAKATRSHSQVRPRRSRSLQRSTRAVISTGKATGALSNNRTLVASPASRPPRSKVLGGPSACNSAHHTRAMALSRVPSSITNRPCRARGINVRATMALAKDGPGSRGRRRRCTKANNGTRAVDSRAGPSLSRASGGKAEADGPVNRRQRLISSPMIQCSPGGLLR